MKGILASFRTDPFYLKQTIESSEKEFSGDKETGQKDKTKI